MAPQKVAQTTALDESTDFSEVWYGRGARVGLLALLLVTVLFAAGALFAKFNLEAFRAGLEERLEEQMGAELRTGRISVNGLRGISIERLELIIEPETGPHAYMLAPLAHININLNQLLYGHIRIDEIVLDNARFRVKRPEDAQWYDGEQLNFDEILDLPTNGFRVTGRNCKFEIRNIVGDTQATIERFRFDVSRPAGSSYLTANLEGDLSGDTSKHLNVRLTMASFDDFDLSIRNSKMTAEDVNVFLPAQHQLVETGTASPTLWVGGRPGETFTVSLEAPFENLSIRDQPEFIHPANGKLMVHATYSIQDKVLTVTTAKADSDQLSGGLEGSISFATMYPTFDLRLKATRFPIVDLLNYSLDGRIEEYGETEISIDEPNELILALEGTSDKPLLSGRISSGSGKLAFTPADAEQLRLSLQLGVLDLEWDASTGSLAGLFTVASGQAHHEPTGFTAEALSGIVTLREGVLATEAITGRIAGKPFVGSLKYDFESTDGELTFEGTLGNLQETFLAGYIKDTHIEGDLNIIGGKVVKKGDRYSIDADIDATQTAIDYAWWFSKPAGVGAISKIHVDVEPGKSSVLDFNGEIASSQIIATINLEYDDDYEKPWRVQSARAQSNHLDVTALGTCLRLPYRITGDIGTQGQFYWERDPFFKNGWRQLATVHFDEISILPIVEGDSVPMVCKGLSVESVLVNGYENTSTLGLVAREAVMPGFGDPWFLPLDRTTRQGVAMPLIDRNWEYELEVASFQLPPWRGENFRATAYSDAETTGLESYSVEIEGGTLEGEYHAFKAAHSFESSVRWSDVPAKYFLEHLHFPNVLTGKMSGHIDYSLDRDDPNTLSGEGEFSIHDGQFSADYLGSLLEGRMENELASLPPSLKFNEVKGRVILDKDIIKTPEILLSSNGIQMDAEGQYVREGDMDYRINMAIAPDVAAQIPVLRDGLNVQGFSLANKDIPLSFRIEGPTFNPQGQLEKLPPPGVTLVSGTLQVTSQVIDFPRRLLIDVLKTAAGLVGVKK